MTVPSKGNIIELNELNELFQWRLTTQAISQFITCCFLRN
jgi:hypothetical protein